MKSRKNDIDFDTLLKSAADVSAESQPEMPLGFDTRVLARVRSNTANGNAGLASLAQRVALLATCVIVLATAAVYWQQRANSESYGSLPNEYAMADTAIDNALSR